MTAYLDEDSERQESDIFVKFKAVISTPLKLIYYGLRLLSLRRRNSIAVLLVCEDRTGLKNLVDLYAFSELQFMLEDIFTSLLLADDPQVTRVHVKKLVWELSDYCRCSQYFNPLPKCKLFSKSILPGVNCLFSLH